MLILLPPSEGKTAPRRGKPPRPRRPWLPRPSTAARERVLDALVDALRRRPRRGPPRPSASGRTQADLVARNAALRTAPTARADAGLHRRALRRPRRRHALARPPSAARGRRLAVTSALFGLVRPADRIPAYRLSGDASLPGLGPVAGVWREHLGAAVGRRRSAAGCCVDLRSSDVRRVLAARRRRWRPASPRVRVLHEVGRPAHGGQPLQQGHQGPARARPARGRRRHRGRPVRLADLLAGLGWKVELGAAGRAGHPARRGRLRRQCTQRRGRSAGR